MAVIHQNSFRLAVIILAAGASARMGRPKLLLPWGETTVLGYLIECWSRLPVEQIAVVCAEGNSALYAELDRLDFPLENRIINPKPERGMFSSIQCAVLWAGWKSSVTHWAVALGDQPLMRPETLRAVVDFAARHPESICQPARNGHGRHPVFFPNVTFMSLADSKAGTLKQFLETRAAGVKLFESDDTGLDLDLDTPADYTTALKLCLDQTESPSTNHPQGKTAIKEYLTAKNA